MRGVYLLVGERLHRVSERVVWAPLRPRTDAGLQSKTWRLLLDRDSIEELSKGRSARYSYLLQGFKSIIGLALLFRAIYSSIIIETTLLILGDLTDKILKLFFRINRFYICQTVRGF